MYQIGSNIMSLLSQFERKAPTRPPAANPKGLLALIDSLRQTATALANDISVEETQTQQFDPNDPTYPMTARSMRQRMKNIQRTIAQLEARRVFPAKVA